MPVQTKSVVFEMLKNTENGMDEFKRWLDVELHRQIVTVVFTKADGTERTMRCTLNAMAIPAPAVPDTAPDHSVIKEAKAPRKPNPNVRTCYDVDGQAWKSFRWDSVKSVTYEDGIIGYVV